MSAKLLSASQVVTGRELRQSKIPRTVLVGFVRSHIPHGESGSGSGGNKANKRKRIWMKRRAHVTAVYGKGKGVL